MSNSIPIKYIPKKLSKKDKKKQLLMINKSRKLYKKKQYFTRKKLPSFKSKTSQHILNAKKIYNINAITTSNELSKKTGCSINALKKVISKGEGAYYSSGSRPNQTSESWAYARLASSITGGKAAVIDFSILQNGCKKNSKALKLAIQAKNK
jgi:CRISPR/Cas system CSM-associated protein Csm4 (group 5 of RAMP superfamily)